ncbi:MAG TPA: hypothetical protein VFS23_26730, partial [Vicinamibacterales bacterium]|nr:hypothetical protein [Vicinamibacterales bacterium]
MYGVEGTDVACSAPGATTSTTIYDECERPSEVSFHDANDALVSRVVFSERVTVRYDDFDNPVQEIRS